jgi:hypothetical protein
MIRECKVQKGGLFVGEPLSEFQGVLTGVPHYTGAAAPLLEEKDNGNHRDGVSRQSSKSANRSEDGIAEHGRKRVRKKSGR